MLNETEVSERSQNTGAIRGFLIRLARKPFLVLISIIALSFLFVFAMGKNAVLETNLDAYMPSTHPAFVFSDEAEELFGIEDAVLFAVEHPVSIYNTESLEKIAMITEALSERFEEIDDGDITSLFTAENITSSEWGLEVESFYTEAPDSSEKLAAIRRSVEENEMIYGRIVSRDGTSALIIAEISGDAFDGSFYEELKLFAQEWEGPETVHVAGRPIVEGELGKLGPRDMARMAPLVIIVMFILLFLLLRSFRDTIINIVIVAFGTLAAFGAMALTGVPVYSVDTMIPVMLIAIGVAYGIHMHNSIHHLVREYPGISKEDLVARSLKAMVRPVSMAAITTAVGFSSLMTSQVLPVRYFGLFASLGVMTEMALAL
ncbi:MAG: MMPL family transporter, partial [Spirochaetaceae bacterium]|nr:MMPL family transporter [Spirochaetaceae bacterium]